MKKFIQLALWAFLQVPAFCSSTSLRVYTYDSLTGKNSFGEFLAESFLKKTGTKVEFISFGTAGEALNQILIEGPKTKADLVMGVDELLFLRVQKKQLFEEVESASLKNLESPFIKNRLDPSFVPFDYGFLAFVFDSSTTTLPSPIRLSTFSKWLTSKQKIALQDPRTSSLGLEFLVWTYESLGNQAKDFWKGISPFVLTFSPGWSGAYELFLKKQVDFVLSYTTSPAYHSMREGKKNITSLLFSEGHFKQVEGLAILKTSPQKDLARKFIELVLSQEAQTQLPTFQWMYPARAGVKLPKDFQEIPIPKPLKIDWTRVVSERENWIKDWTYLLSQERK